MPLSLTRLALPLAALATALAPTPAQALDAGRTLLVSRPSGLGALPFEGFSSSSHTAHAISADGTKVVFASNSDALSPDDDNRYINIFVRDRTTHQTTLVSRGMGGAPADDWSDSPSISADGTHVAFVSYATNLVAGGTNGAGQVYVVDLADLSTVRASVAAGGAAGDHDSYNPVLDADGSRVAFGSTTDFGATNVAASDNNGFEDVYVRDLGASHTLLASATSGGAAVGNGPSYGPSISEDGQRVAFTSQASNFAHANGNDQSVVHDFGNDTTAVVSVTDGAAGTPMNNGSLQTDISGDGTKVAFVTSDKADPADDDNFFSDAYVRDLELDTTTLVGRQDGAGGQPLGSIPGRSVQDVRIDEDGGVVAIGARVNGGPPATFYVRSGTTTIELTGQLTHYADSLSLSGTGGTIVFGAWDAGLAQAYGGNTDWAGVYARGATTAADTTELISRPSGSDAPPTIGSPDSQLGNAHAVSADGRYVVFVSSDDQLADDDDDSVSNVYRRDMLTNETILVSRGDDGAGGNGDSRSPSISADGTRVAFESNATNLVQDDGNASSDVFVRDIPGHTTLLAGHGADGAVPQDGAGDPVLSADGSTVAYVTMTSLDPTHDSDNADVYVQSLGDPAGPILASRAAGAGTDGGNNNSESPSLSADGRRVAFASYADNLVAGDNGIADVFVRDLDTDTTVRASVADDGSGADGEAQAASLSDDGTRVAFMSLASNLVDVPTPTSVRQAYVRDLAAGSTTLVSRADGSDGAVADEWVSSGEISGDGKQVVFVTSAPALAQSYGVAPSRQAYLRTLSSDRTQLVSRADGSDGAAVVGWVDAASANRDGSCVAFLAYSEPLEPGLSYSPDFGRVHVRALSASSSCAPPPAGGGPGTPPGPPAGPPPGPPAGPPVARDVTAPQITEAKLSRSRFRARRSTRVSLSYTLSEQATVHLRFDRVLAGRRRGKRCVKPRHGLKRHCTRYVPAGSLKAPGARGRDKIRITGLIGKHRLAPGRYRLTIEARDAAGNVRRRAVTFSIAR